MRRTVLVCPGLASPSEDGSVLRQKLPALERLAELGEVFKIAPLPPAQTPEALYLGMPPDQAQMAQGPLTVAALGADPPERSTHFHLSLLSFVDGQLYVPKTVPTPEEEALIWSLAKKLDTASLTLLQGERLDHALVWEGMGDLGTRAPHEVDGKPLRPSLPEGDAEPILRRLIDDSINLLGELEMNERRLDQGLQPLNLLWPWGHGLRAPVPNLFLRRGEQAVVESGSMRMQGLTRLASYKHEDRSGFGRLMGVRLAEIAQRALKRPLTLVLIETPAELRRLGRLEELEWFTRELDEKLLSPLADDLLREAGRLTLLALGDAGPGVGLIAESKTARNALWPFDERVFEERLAPTRDLWAAVEQGLLSPTAVA